MTSIQPNTMSTYFESFKMKTTRINKESNLNFDTSVIHGETEISKERTAIFIKLKPAELIRFEKDNNCKIQFKL